MPNARISQTKEVAVSPNLLAFKPRQVLLLQQQQQPSICTKPTTSTTLNHVTMTKQGTPTPNATLSPSQRDTLVRSVARFLQRSGFSKTLKKLRFEAKFQEDDFGDCLFDLEVVLLKYLEICGDGSKDIGTNKESVSAGAELKEKKKADSLVQGLSEDVNLVNSEMRNKKKEKKQKKEKKKVSSDEQVDGQKQDEGIKLKKKENNSIPESVSNDKSDMLAAGKPNQVEDHVMDKQDTKSKKRKRHASDKDDAQASEKKTIDESKRRKTGMPEEAKLSEQAMTTSSLGNSDGEEIVHLDSNQSRNGSSKQIDGHANGDLKENGEKSVDVNSIKKPRKGSAEPTSAKRFQRVNAEEIVISNERLQDNSYWAKDGAETGYGAKAEEILSQVRGKGFRHEKTKKKRGSYRGGQIDVHSHSVKFNYSDEE